MEFWKTARMDQGLSQGEVAKKLGYRNGQLVSNWERGLCLPPRKDLPKLSKLYRLGEKHIIHWMLKQEEAELLEVFRGNKNSRDRVA